MFFIKAAGKLVSKQRADTWTKTLTTYSTVVFIGLFAMSLWLFIHWGGKEDKYPCHQSIFMILDIGLLIMLAGFLYTAKVISEVIKQEMAQEALNRQFESDI
jgi:hypothetical protein